MDNVLSEVEDLFEKLQTLPNNIREAAFKRIQEKITHDHGTHNHETLLKPSVVHVETYSNDVLISDADGADVTDNIFAVPEVIAEINMNSKPSRPKTVHVNVHPVSESININDIFKDPSSTAVDASSSNLNPSSENKSVTRRKKSRRSPRCKFCKRYFNSNSSLKVHLKRHYNQRDFKCTYCPSTFIAKNDLQRHLARHNSYPQKMCEYCGKPFPTNKAVVAHISRIHKKNQIILHCNECKYSTNNKTSLIIHMRITHLLNFYTHVCPICDKRVSTRLAFRIHMQGHTGDKPFKCKQCNLGFRNAGSLNVHVKNMHCSRRFQCKICNKQFQSKFNLERHETSVHINNKDFSCHFCEFKCNISGNLTKHIRKIHDRKFIFKEYKGKKKLIKFNKEMKDKSLADGSKVAEKYLEGFSKVAGKKVTIDDLKLREEERKAQEMAEIEKNKLEFIRKRTMQEHSYGLPPPKSDDEKKSSTNNIYLEAMAAANLDFSCVEPEVEGYPEINIVALDPNTNEEYTLPGVKPITDTIVSNYSLPTSFNLDSSAHANPTQNVIVELSNGEKIQVNLNVLAGDHSVMDLVMNEVDGLVSVAEQQSDLMPSVMIVVTDQQAQI